MTVIGNFKFILPKGKALETLKDFSFNITKDLKECGIDEIKLRNLILEDAIDSETHLLGSLIFGTSEMGIRKIRLSKGDNKGKRGGYRLIAYVICKNHTAYLIHIYDKKKKKDLSKSDEDNLKRIMKTLG